MTALLAILCIALIVIIAVQIGRVTELAAKLRGEEEMEEINNKRNSRGALIFLVVFLVGCIVSAYVYRNYMLGYGPHEAASIHGKSLDSLFNVTLVVTGIVFIATHIALFWFSYKYRADRSRKAMYIPHNNTIEIVWTAIPAVVMAFLVIGGLDVWNEVMADVGPDEDYLEVEATGYQFAWILRHPGTDKELGKRNYKIIDGINPLGQDWNDSRNHDDIHLDELVLPVGQKVRVRITSRDVLHNFYLPHFRVKMDAVPGMPTYFVFTPDKTTEEYRRELSKYDEYKAIDPNGDGEQQLWETFNFVLACAELCGNGHFSMKKNVRIVSQEEYEDWLSTQSSYYMTSIRGTDNDPLSDILLPVEITERKQELTDAFETVVTAPDSLGAKIVTLNYVQFETGSADLTALSSYEIENLAEILKQRSTLNIELGGHTDNTGDFATNQVLSQQRAEVVLNKLVELGIDASRLRAVGYGSSQPIDDADTDAAREKNRRTEVTILGNPTF